MKCESNQRCRRRVAFAASCVWALVTFHPFGSIADEQSASNSLAPRREPLGIYIDCRGFVCDHDFLRLDIMFVRHLRDQRDADVHVLISMQPTAEGGRDFNLDFIGQKAFAGVHDSLNYVVHPADSADKIRQGLSNAIKRGLVQYANRTSLSEDIVVVYIPTAALYSGASRDRWNHWSFATAVNGFVTGEQSVQSMSLGVALSANRTTESSKVSTSVQTQINNSTFSIDPEHTIKNVQRSVGVNTLVVKGVNDHVSIGGRTSALHSRFLNQAMTFRLAPALEFNVFPYRESTRRMLTFEYSVGGVASEYQERTIFGKTSETLFDQRLLASLRLTQKWGSAQIAAEAGNYLHDWRKHRMTVFGSADWKLAKGVSLVTTVDVKRIRDQLFLPARGASAEEILLRERQLMTSYSYSASFGITYTFGSPFAQIVNRRFSGTMGTMNIVQ